MWCKWRKGGKRSRKGKKEMGKCFAINRQTHFFLKKDKRNKLNCVIIK